MTSEQQYKRLSCKDLLDMNLTAEYPPIADEPMSLPKTGKPTLQEFVQDHRWHNHIDQDWYKSIGLMMKPITEHEKEIYRKQYPSVDYFNVQVVDLRTEEVLEQRKVRVENGVIRYLEEVSK